MAECRKNFRDLLAAHGVLRVELGLLASGALANRVDPVRIAVAVAVLADRAGCWAVLVLVRGTWVEARRYSIRSMAPNFHYPPCSATSRHRSKSLRASVTEPGALINLRRLCCWHWWRRRAGQCPVLAGRWSGCAGRRVARFLAARVTALKRKGPKEFDPLSTAISDDGAVQASQPIRATRLVSCQLDSVINELG
jgi:hypothetical protein